MSLRAITWAFDQHETTPTQRLVLLALADHADGDNESWPSIELLMEKTGLSKATIYRALSDLIRERVIDEVKSVKGYRAWELLLSQAETGSSQSETDESQGENPSTYRNPQGTLIEPSDLLAEAIETVWRHYTAKPEIRERPLPPGERKLIRDSLRERNADDPKAAAVDLCLAIDGCFSSDYHMKRRQFSDRKGGVYNRLSQIIKGRRGQETTNERIDFFIDRAETSGIAESSVPSADPAVIARRKQEVQRGHRLKGDRVAMRKAEEAEAWLLRHGIEVVRDAHADGYPAFREATGGTE